MTLFGTGSPSVIDRIRWMRSLYGRHLRSSTKLAFRLGSLPVDHISVIDCGCGRSDTVVSRQVLRLPFRLLVAVDGFPDVLALAARRPCRAARRELLCLPISALPDHYGRQKTFDVALCLDVLEHLPKSDALAFLADLESIVRRRIVVWMPLGEYRVDADPHGRGNDLERHRSFWEAGELARLGYEVEVMPRFHLARYDAMWAIKVLGG